MIDPKLNEVPVNRTGTGTQNAEPAPAEAQRRSRAGLSITDTIAGDTLLSTGSRGVDVSGVEAGAGAGAGSTITTPGLSNSPAPTIVPGGRSTGTTARGTTPSGRSSTDIVESDAENEVHGFAHEEVAARAYECWCERGRPSGSPELDWNQAIRDLRQRRGTGSASSSRTSAASA